MKTILMMSDIGALANALKAKSIPPARDASPNINCIIENGRIRLGLSRARHNSQIPRKINPCCRIVSRLEWACFVGFV